MGILAAYDTVGIQNYIFASNKLAENVGGSKLVADIFSKLLPEVLIEVTDQPSTDWQNGGALNPSLSAEIIYQGGGNAFVAFLDDAAFHVVTERFLIRVNQTAPGVGIAVAAIETDFDDTYQSDFEKLNKRLASVKGGFNTPAFAGNQPITKQSGRTGLPVSVFSNGEYLSASQAMKRDRYTGYKKEYSSGIKNFEDLAIDKGTDSLIAIIHADGNNMGKCIKSFMKGFKTYGEAIPEIRRLSAKIDNCYRTARERTITAFKEAYEEYIAGQRAKFPAKDYSDEPPLLELIGDGDDTTLITGGRFALDLAVRLLREIEKTPEQERPFEGAMPTACAGVVLFHSHYPFSEAYKLAEELCSSAKRPSREYEGSYVDFHLHQSGSASGLRVLRGRQYMVDGLTILRRPWRITCGEEKLPNFKWFERSIDVIKKMPRNKTKSIRNAIGAGENAAETAENQMRGEKLPEFTCPAEIGMSRYAPYFDILEMYDAYENLLNKEDGEDA